MAAPASPGHSAHRVAAQIALTPSRPAAVAGGQRADGPAAPHRVLAPLAPAPSIPVGSGPVPNGTFLSFSISGKVSLRVNVGSGDALLTTSDITIPEIGSSLTLGTSYNSLLVGSGVAVGSNGHGWRSREGADVQLYPASDGSVTYLGEDGTAGKFIPSGSGYASPPQFHVTLVKSSGSTCGATGYTMTWHASGRVMCFTSAGLLTSEADRYGNTTAFGYNGSSQETKVTFTPRGASSPTRTVTASYAGSYLTGFTQSGGSAGTKSVSYAVNSSTGDLTSLTQADGTKISFGYDSSHDLTSVSNGDSVATTLVYNSAHQVTSVTQATTGSTTATTRLDYASATQTLTADPNTSQSDSVPSVPHVTYTVASSSSLITAVTDQQGNSRSASYTSFNDVAAYTNGVGMKATNTYGANGGESVTKSASPTGAAVSFAYANSATSSNPTANFQQSSSSDAQGNATAYIYDGAGNLLQSSDALAATAKVTYNSDGTPATSTDPMNGSNSTTYGYTDGNHELTKVTPPTGNSLRPGALTYDGFGRLLTTTDGAGNTTAYTYDLADRITKVAYTGGSQPVTVTYAYDGAGNLKTRVDSSGTTTWTYDGRNLVTSRTATSGGGTLTYGYDLDANLTTVIDPNPKEMGGSATTTYSYDTRNLLDEMIDPTGGQWRFAYDADGRRTTTWFDTNSTESTWVGKMMTTYDSSGRISRIQAFTNNDLAADVDTSYCYSPFVSGKSCPTASASTDTSLVQYATGDPWWVSSPTVSVNSYDKGNRLTKVTNNVNGMTSSYGYDADGNLTSANDNGTAATWSFNSANEVTSSGYAYDGAGNQTSDPVAGTMTYNSADQMTQATPLCDQCSSRATENFTYADRSQAEVLSDGSASNITYGLAGQTGQPWVQDYTAPPGSGFGIYALHDQKGDLLGEDTNGFISAYVTDNTGSVIATIDNGGIVNNVGPNINSGSYTPYGYFAGAGAIDPLFTFTGALQDATGLGNESDGTGFQHLGQRWYDPAAEPAAGDELPVGIGSGRFTQPDSTAHLANPANGNLYAYAADSPTNYIDPTGASSCASALFGYAGLGGFLVGTGEGAVAIAEGAVFTTAAVAVGGILGAVFGIGLAVVAIAAC
jgi:YD repeat-containing protein